MPPTEVFSMIFLLNIAKKIKVGIITTVVAAKIVGQLFLL